jgi:hypothetical protein
MNRLKEEMKLIPRGAWAAAGLAYVLFVATVSVTIVPRDEGLSSMPPLFKVFFVIVMPLFVATYTLLVGYVNGDARRRGMRHMMWTLLAIFVPNAIGIILYFVLREPPARLCERCGASARGTFSYCPSCGSAMARICPACGKPSEEAWSHCPHCGAGLRAA